MATPTFALLLTVLSFLCPLSSSAFPGPVHHYDDQSLTSVLSKQVFTSNINFCTLAKRGCSNNLNTFKPFNVIYEVYQGIDNKSPYTPKFDFSFFKESDLRPGNKINLDEMQEEFPERGDLKKEASRIVCYAKELQKLLAQPSTSDVALQSAIMKYCKKPSLEGSKTQVCAKSLEQMVEFSKTALGTKHLVALTTKSNKIKETGTELRIGNVKKMVVNKMVTCHGVLLDSATYFCHLIPTRQVIYVVDVMKLGTKAPINTVLAICHMDTSKWSEDHVAFKALQSSPGKTEACHWNTDLDLLWVGDY